MNIQRYKMPVIIAASLHGALFLIMPEGTAVTPPESQDPAPEWSTPVVEELIPVELTPADEVEHVASGGGPALPSLPDLPPLLQNADFTVPISRTVPPITAIKDLGEYRGNGDGPGIGPGDMVGVPIPGVGSLDRAPRAIVQPSPDYPATLRNDGLGGSVTVEFIVDTTGRVVTADAVKWTRREFVEPAIRAVLRWRFEPGTISGRKVRFRMAVPIEFEPGR